MSDPTMLSRRSFLQWSALTGLAACATQGTWAATNGAAMADLKPNMLGIYGPWAAEIVGDKIPEASFRHRRWKRVQAWRKRARALFKEAILQPEKPFVPKAEVLEVRVEDGLHIELLQWQLPYGPPTQAVFLKPAGARGPLPAVLGLHDHGGVKFFGKEKITKVGDVHPFMRKHQQQYYGGRAWANELARRGYAVLVHDTFLFGSRRVRLREIPLIVRRIHGIHDLEEIDPSSEEQIRRYNRFAAEHEHLVAKSLFCAGTTWPGVFTYEDQRALDYLCSRPEVDERRVGCAGLSGGGLRTVYLAALDERIQAACCAGMMTTWRDYLLNKSFTHTWMIYVPALPRKLDYPELLAIMCPKPVLVLNCEKDFLFTMPEMKRAERIIAEIYAKAGVPHRFRCSYYPVPHRFDEPMQAEVFEFFDRTLKA